MMEFHGTKAFEVASLDHHCATCYQYLAFLDGPSPFVSSTLKHFTTLPTSLAGIENDDRVRFGIVRGQCHAEAIGEAVDSQGRVANQVIT